MTETSREAKRPIEEDGQPGGGVSHVDQLHVHGGLLYRGESMPTLEQLAAWARELEQTAAVYLEGLTVGEARTRFTLDLQPGDPPAVEVRAEVHAVLGNSTGGPE